MALYRVIKAFYDINDKKNILQEGDIVQINDAERAKTNLKNGLIAEVEIKKLKAKAKTKAKQETKAKAKQETKDTPEK